MLPVVFRMTSSMSHWPVLVSNWYNSRIILSERAMRKSGRAFFIMFQSRGSKKPNGINRMMLPTRLKKAADKEAASDKNNLIVRKGTKLYEV